MEIFLIGAGLALPMLAGALLVKALGGFLQNNQVTISRYMSTDEIEAITNRAWDGQEDGLGPDVMTGPFYVPRGRGKDDQSQET